MVTPLTRSEQVAKGLTLDESVREELERLRSAGALGDCVKTEPRCWVCCEAESKELVNKLIAAGLTNREIVESCGRINGRRQANGDTRIIEAGNIYRHRKEHFNIDQPAQAIYREILERRAEEANRDHVNGVGHAITPYAVLETVMAKGYNRIAATESVVSTEQAISAAVKLHELSSKDASQKKMADLIFKMDRIVNAIFTVVPKQYHEEILRLIDDSETTHQVVEQLVAPVRRELTPNRNLEEGEQI